MSDRSINQMRSAFYGHGLVNPKVKAPSHKLDRMVIAQVALCILPAMGLLYLGNPLAADKWLHIVLLLMLTRYLLLRNRQGFVSLTISAAPALMLLRGLSFNYNLLLAILGLGLILWLIVSAKEFSQIWRDLTCRWLFFLGGFYWLLSFLWTGEYYVNLRVLELVFSAASVYLLAKHREYLATALIGISISALSVGLALLPHGSRLGASYVEGYVLGNPISVGIPLALVFLLTIADDGKWLLLEDQRVWRLALGLACGALLVVSTSRGSLAIVVANMAVLMLIGGKRQRAMLIAMLGLLTLVIVLLLGTSKGDYIAQFYEKTFSSDRSMAQRSSGRSDQWYLFPRVWQDSPVWGYGPGSGNAVYAQYSLEADEKLHSAGKELAWHTLYLQVGVEAGTIGIMGLTLLLVPLLVRGLTHSRLSGETTPLIGILGFMVIGLSVSGTDVASGIFLGLGFLSVKRRTAHHFRWERGGGDPRLQSLLKSRAATINSLTRRETSKS